MNAQPLAYEDEALEAQIASAYQDLITAAGHEAQCQFCAELYRLIKKRSPTRIAQMESELFGDVLLKSSIPSRQRQHG